jgi:SAM-dependent methyltransferase
VGDPTSVPIVSWREGDASRSAQWRAHGDALPAARIVVAEGSMTPDEIYGLACQGTALLWRGDFQDARRVLSAMSKRIDRRARVPSSSRGKPLPAPADAFHRYRMASSQRARTLNALLIPLEDDYTIPLPRAPDIREACEHAWGPAGTASIAPLRALLGAVSAREWRLKGIDIPEVGGRIHPHFGVFAPIRREYLDLVSTAPLPIATTSNSVAFDIGTGTGVLAAVLARRGIDHVIATDVDERALACARDNLDRLGLSKRVEVVRADLFPDGRAPLAVCNPPWIPARPSSPLENAIYDPESRMLRGFLRALPDHLAPGGEGWLILSDLAEHLGLRTRDELLGEFAAAGLRVVGRHDVPPRHPRVADDSDPLHAARAAEITSLWRLAVS